MNDSAGGDCSYALRAYFGIGGYPGLYFTLAGRAGAMIITCLDDNLDMDIPLNCYFVNC